MRILNPLAAMLVVCFLIFIVIKHYVIEENKIDTNYRYTLGKIYAFNYPVDGGPDAEFRYCVKDVGYKGSIQVNPYERKLSVGDTILVKYYVPDPALARGQYQNPVDKAEYKKFDSSGCTGR
ncbi:MAG: hypothetical protein EOP50_11210 [Sphingobacteriales bacterium]|nr:MAG: hypothetical protein EOP50_11210 [Sphingobacteriales bacterium]